MAINATDDEIRDIEQQAEKCRAGYERRLKMRENARKWRESERGKAIRAKYEAEHKEQKRAYDKVYYATVRKKRRENEAAEKIQAAKEKKRIYDRERYQRLKMACLQ
jgi:hypothetical protein